MTSTTQVLSDILVTQIVPMAVAAYLSISVSSAVVHTALKLTFQSFHYSNLKVSGNGLCQHNVNKAAMLADNSHIMRVLLQCRANLRGQVFSRGQLRRRPVLRVIMYQAPFLYKTIIQYVQYSEYTACIFFSTTNLDN